MDWVESKSIWCLRPEFAKVFVGRESLEGLESSGEVVCPEEVGQVRFELVMGVLAKRHDDGFLFDRQNRGPGNGWASAAIRCGLALLPLGDRLRVDAVVP